MMSCTVTGFRFHLTALSCLFLPTVPFSEIFFLAVAIGSACAVMIIIVIAVVLFQHFRKRRWAKRAEKDEGIKS